MTLRGADDEIYASRLEEQFAIYPEFVQLVKSVGWSRQLSCRCGIPRKCCVLEANQVGVIAWGVAYIIFRFLSRE